MCNVHFKFNQKKKLKEFRVAEELQTVVNNDVTDLHCSLSEDEFNNIVNIIKAKWLNYQGLDQFRVNFFKDWIESRFKRWQLFRTPSAGVVTTNSGNESWKK